MLAISSLAQNLVIGSCMMAPLMASSQPDIMEPPQVAVNNHPVRDFLRNLLFGRRTAAKPVIEDRNGYVPVEARQLTELVHDRGSLFDNGINRFLSVEMHDQSIDADKLMQMAASLTRNIKQDLEALSAGLSADQRAAIARIARNSEIDLSVATTEYLANAVLFRILRDYFDLPEREELLKDETDGFVALSQYGSLLSSPPLMRAGDYRTFHYMRMPSRSIELKTGSHTGCLEKNISVGKKLITSGLRSSPVQILLVIPPEKAELFKNIRHYAESFASTSRVVSRTS